MEYALMKNSEIKRCVKLASTAFENYDFFTAFIDKNWKKKLYLKSMLATEYRVNKKRAHFLVAKEKGKIVAIAIIHDPDYQMASIFKYLIAGIWKTILIGGYKNVAAWYQMDKQAISPCRNLKQAWFIHLLAVDNEMEGKGIGSRMLKEFIIPYIKDHGGKTISLYTNTSLNCRFYIKNGFNLFHHQNFTYRNKSFGSWSFKMNLK